MNKAVRIATAVLIAAGALAYHHFVHQEAGGDAQTMPGVAIAATTKAFTMGSLHFSACELKQPGSSATTAAYCAPFEVPENWDTPATGRKIKLRLALIAATGASVERDLVVLLAGGPGQSAIDSWPQISAAFAPLREHRHVLLLDQRGTGGSNALTCPHDESADHGFDLGKIAAQTRTCLASTERHADPRFYTTGMALRDLEALRQALGAPQLDLIGVSYGTRVAQQYVRRYPDAVRSVVLDSAVPNELVLGSEFAVNLDAALKAQFAICTKTPACRNAFGDPWASLHKLRDALRAQPVEVAYRDPNDGTAKTMHLDEFSLALLARMYAYTPETSALLPLAIAQALRGDHAPLASQVQMLDSELESLSDNAMQLSVLCSEDIDLLVPRPQDADTLLGTRMQEAFEAQCAVWPHGTRSADFHAPLVSDKPVLILSGEFDPVTPPRYAQQIVKTLSNARVLVANGQGHSDMGRGCFPKLVARFVERPDPKRLDAGCIADFGPIPAFTSFNGAAP